MNELERNKRVYFKKCLTNFLARAGNGELRGVL